MQWVVSGNRLALKWLVQMLLFFVHLTTTTPKKIKQKKKKQKNENKYAIHSITKHRKCICSATIWAINNEHNNNKMLKHTIEIKKSTLNR